MSVIPTDPIPSPPTNPPLPDIEFEFNFRFHNSWVPTNPELKPSLPISVICPSPLAVLPRAVLISISQQKIDPSDRSNNTQLSLLAPFPGCRLSKCSLALAIKLVTLLTPLMSKSQTKNCRLQRLYVQLDNFRAINQNRSRNTHFQSS